MLGMELDLQQRQSTEGACTNSDAQKCWVEHAQKAIYVKGKPIGSKHVEDLLKNESLVPTRVSLIHLISYNVT